jgi:hypothetical protein
MVYMVQNQFRNRYQVHNKHNLVFHQLDNMVHHLPIMMYNYHYIRIQLMKQLHQVHV